MLIGDVSDYSRCQYTIIHCNICSWPLLWDPDGIAYGLIANLHKDRKICTIQLGTNSALEEMKEAVKNGDVVVLYDVKTYDSGLSSLLKKDVIAKGRQLPRLGPILQFHVLRRRELRLRGRDGSPVQT